MIEDIIIPPIIGRVLWFWIGWYAHDLITSIAKELNNNDK